MIEIHLNVGDGLSYRSSIILREVSNGFFFFVFKLRSTVNVELPREQITLAVTAEMYASNTNLLALG